MKISVDFVHPPIPARNMDYCAMFDCDDGDSGRQGWGETAHAAARDLLDNEYEFLVGRALDEFERHAKDPFAYSVAEVAKQWSDLKETMRLLRIADTQRQAVPADLMLVS